MRRTTVRLLALSAAALALAACSDRSVISGRIDGAADSELIIKQLDVNRFAVLDTIKTDGGETIVLGDGLGVSLDDTFAADEREKALTPMPSVSERVEILEQMVTEMLFGGVYGQI